MIDLPREHHRERSCQQPGQDHGNPGAGHLQGNISNKHAACDPAPAIQLFMFFEDGNTGDQKTQGYKDNSKYESSRGEGPGEHQYTDKKRKQKNCRVFSTEDGHGKSLAAVGRVARSVPPIVDRTNIIAGYANTRLTHIRSETRRFQMNRKRP